MSSRNFPRGNQNVIYIFFVRQQKLWFYNIRIAECWKSQQPPHRLPHIETPKSCIINDRKRMCSHTDMYDKTNIPTLFAATNNYRKSFNQIILNNLRSTPEHH